MKEKPYIGVTGPTSIEEVEHLREAFRESGITLDTPHIPMMGILLSLKTLTGQEVTNRRYPNFDSIPNLLEETRGTTFNTIHYNTQDKTTLSDQIEEIFKGEIYPDNLCRGLQLNVIDPPPKQVAEIKAAFADLKIILQLSKKTFIDKAPLQVVHYVNKYKDALSYCLIDPSGGAGQEFESYRISRYFRALRNHFPELGIGVAGGFTGENLSPRVKQLIGFIGDEDISTDAEGGLRDKLSNEYGDDIYNSLKVKSYLKASGKVFLQPAS